MNARKDTQPKTVSLSKETALEALMMDAAEAIAASAEGPPDLFDHAEIAARLAGADAAFPPLYRSSVSRPLRDRFTQMGEAGWVDLLNRDRALQGVALLALDLVQAQTQRAEAYLAEPTEAMQEVVSDLYDGFLSAADRGGVLPPDHGVAPPLVKWGRPGFGPYAWTAPAAALYGCGAGVVNLPPAFAARGLAGWASLGHETAGHHILHADDGLREALARAVEAAILRLPDASIPADERPRLAAYWAQRIDESASDAMGVLNMGPAAAIGLLAYFRALGLVTTGEARLSAFGSAAGEHPAPLTRFWLMAKAVGLCSFPGAAAWQAALTAEADADAKAQGDKVSLAGATYSAAVAKAAAKAAAKAILQMKVAPLEGRALRDIQDWRARDQRIVEALAIHAVIGGVAPPQGVFGGVFAAHAVAAGITAALVTGNARGALGRMIGLAAAMHRANLSWSALGPATPGDFEHVHLSGASPWHAWLHRRAAPPPPPAPPPAPPGDGPGGIPVPVRFSGDGRGGPPVPVLLETVEGSETSSGPGGIPIGYVPLSGDGWTEAGEKAIIAAIAGGERDAPMLNWILRRLGLEMDKKGALTRRKEEGDAFTALTPEALAMLLGKPR